MQQQAIEVRAIRKESLFADHNHAANLANPFEETI
jgi:hypothetical protein